ncbi:hypothetical protein [Flammeovirga sp. SJP92]|uniref:hypothetical protein n=1 Tax=Flammeovirga sp. SJP92 TaxID=1775430 RepID=UPI0007879D00|nr:hypothetical protein [Flammeovirga sp. SJP92]KXX71969.1 hypothetical protein AVL50_04075 [Flammeovirga sp. SJP92]
MKLISSFAQFLEEKSDKSIYPEQYHFDFAFTVKQISPTESKDFYILVPKQEKYFAMTSALDARDIIVFDIELDQMIVICNLDSSQYAICGPLSFFDTNKNTDIKYNFIEQQPNVYKDDNHNLEIVLTQDSEFNNYGLKKGFWMIIQESSTLDIPLSEKGIILKVKKLDKKSGKNTSYDITERNDININYSIKMSRLLDFSILADSTFIKQKD